MNEYWNPGQVIVHREIRRGHPVHGYATYVVAHDWEQLVTFFAPGSQLASPGEHPPAEDAARQHGTLTLQRPDDAYAVDVLWEGPDRTFAGWQVNLQAPLRRREHGIDTLSHRLAYRIRPDGTTTELHRDLFERRVADGRWSAEEAAQINAAGRAVTSMLEWRNQWWDTSWAGWRPPVHWGSLRLPEDWAGRDVA